MILQIAEIRGWVVELLEFIRSDIQSKSNREDTWLYQVIGKTYDPEYNFIDQAFTLYNRTDSSPRKLGVSLEYPKDKTQMPRYVIREPSRDDGIANAIGKMTGQFFSDNSHVIRNTRTNAYEIICFSDNFFESVLMSEIMYALLLGVYNQMASHYHQLQYSMREVMVEQSLMPTPIFLRSIGVRISADDIIPAIDNAELLGKVKFLDAGKAAAAWTN